MTPVSVDAGLDAEKSEGGEDARGLKSSGWLSINTLSLCMALNVSDASLYKSSSSMPPIWRIFLPPVWVFCVIDKTFSIACIISVKCSFPSFVAWTNFSNCFDKSPAFGFNLNISLQILATSAIIPPCNVWTYLICSLQPSKTGTKLVSMTSPAILKSLIKVAIVPAASSSFGSFLLITFGICKPNISSKTLWILS